MPGKTGQPVSVDDRVFDLALFMNESLKKEIGFILKDLLKVVKVVSMYPADNPLPQSMRQSFAEKLVGLVKEFGAFRICVAKGLLEYNGEVVYEDKSKEESLAGLFFDAGITEFEFRSNLRVDDVYKPGLKVDDVYKLLDAVRIYLNTPGHTEDLAGLIWEAEISGFVFETLEDVALSDYDTGFDVNEYLEQDDRQSTSGGGQIGLDDSEKYAQIFALSDAGPTSVEEASLDDSGELSEQPGGHDESITADPDSTDSGYTEGPYGDITSVETAEQAPDTDYGAGIPIEVARALGLDASSGDAPSLPNTTVQMNERFSMSEEETTIVQEMLIKDADFDPYESTFELAKDMLLLESELSGFGETVTICEKITYELVANGKLIEAGCLLAHMKVLEGQVKQEKPAWSERLREASIMAGSRERLAVLAQSMNAHPEVGVTEIKRYLDNFGWESLSGITDLMGEFEHHMHREALKDYLTARGQDNIDIVAKGVFDKRWQVVRNSVTILARIGDARALKYLERVTQHEEPQVRLELVTALKTCPAAESLGLLKELIADPDRAIRGLAVEAIVARHGEAAFEIIGEVIDDKSFASLDRTEQQSLLNAYSSLGGEQAVGYLSQLILRFDLFGDTRQSISRTAAFEALSHNQSERAERLLVKLSSSWRPSIRKQAAYTLQRRRENIYGNDQ